MNSFQSNRRLGAFTLVEMLVVVAIIAILAALLLPVLSEGGAQARRIQCVNNLKEVGLAFHAFAHDHRDRFPMQTPMSDGGSMEFVQSGYRVGGQFYFSYRHFLPLANELVTPKLLYCPAELIRPVAHSFASFNNENLSYFVGINAEFDKPSSILAGDRNITNDWVKSSTILRTGPGNRIRWTEELHRFKGNLLFADGSAMELNSLNLSSVASQAALYQDLVLPTTQPPATLAGLPPANASTLDATSAPGDSPAKDADSNQNSPRPPGSGNRSSSAGSLVVRLRSPAATEPSEIQAPAKPDTNQIAVAASSRTTSAKREDSGASPFMRWFVDAARDVVREFAWLLWLLLLFLVAGFIIMQVRYRSRRGLR